MEALQRLAEADAIVRLRERDASLFTDDIDARIPIMQRLGWTDLAKKAPGRLPLLVNLASALADEGVTDIVLLGMGGSSLTPLVLARVIGSAPEMPSLHVLDTTSPAQVKRLLDTLDPQGVFVLIASKSGTTIEPLSLYAILRAWMDEGIGRPAAGRRFAVITDPGTPLEKLRQRENMRVTLSAPATVGGRFSALSMFGLAPAALIGVDLARLIAPAATMEEACQTPGDENPAALLAAWLGDAYEQDRDKLTLVCSTGLRAFGLWTEQLVAESLGKNGTGVVPVIEHSPEQPTRYGPDRAVVVVRLAEDAELAAWSRETATAHPVFEIVLADEYDIGAEFVRWEHAVALLGHLLGVNPFDEPNVAEAKTATNAILDGSEVVPKAAVDLDGTWITWAGELAQPSPLPPSRVDAVASFAGSARPGDYIALLAYLPDDETLLMPLRVAAAALERAAGVPVCLELGPRYLHSTGQLHKGGPNTGLFMIVTGRDHTDIEIPGKKFTLGMLHRAQAEGDLLTLARHGRRVLRFDLPGIGLHDVTTLADDLGAAVR
ncbi:MAG: hypothetical protein Kow0067_19280 [Coriobacteriia bacterium]